MKKWLTAIISVVLILAVLAGCGSAGRASDAGNGNPASGADSGKSAGAVKRLVFAQASDTVSTEPYNGTSTPSATINFQIFNSLTRTDDKGNVVGDLAESFEALDDVTWQFKLKQGVKFHNGEDFNAEAVKYSVERMLDPELKFQLAPDFEILKEAVVVDDYTVNIVTKEPFAGLPLRLFYLTIVPPGYIAEKGNEYFGQHPVGTGPFKFKEYVKDDHITLEANKDYFKGAPGFDELVFRPIPEEASRIAALEAGEVDLITGISTNQIARLEQNGDLQLVTIPTTRSVYISLNTLQPSILQNKSFRQALNYAVDVDSIINNILEGKATKLSTVFLPHFFGYSDQIEPYPYDPAKAKQLIAESGYKNEPLNFIITPGGGNTKEVAEAVANQLREAGVNVSVLEKESALHRAEMAAGTAGPLWLQTFGGPYNSAEMISRVSFGTGQRYSGLANQELDDLRAKASATLDETKAAELWRQYQENFKEEAPAIFLYQQQATSGFNSKVKGWAPRMDELVLFEGTSL
ncbi:ABC transporter substrate-binding protein [Paenibacillus macerans]|uniref:ABC transporter substrate-binding protein n=1 Tax=Paenibacillus macerans TaxID=44252 RepID=UPI002E23AF96|nr:ABC transporter substrate-binding protein [Paenibacillus macerans]